MSENESPSNHCFVCGPANPIGLRLTFRLEDEVCRAECTPGPDHVGYDDVVHGGIVFAMLDDVMANWLWLQGQQCFTARAEIRYRAPLPVGVKVALEGWCEQRRGRLARLRGRVLRVDDGSVVAEASAGFMLTPR